MAEGIGGPGASRDGVEFRAEAYAHSLQGSAGSDAFFGAGPLQPEPRSGEVAKGTDGCLCRDVLVLLVQRQESG